MEPVCAALGITAGIASIVSLIGKSVCTLHTLGQKYKDAEREVTLLAGQLHTVRIALLEIHRWLDDFEPREKHDQELIQNLDISLDCCRLLVETIDSEISRFEWNDNDSLRFGSKMLRLLEDATINDYMTQLHRQLSALNLVLNVFRCRNPVEQKQLIEKQESRELFTQIKDDATSLRNIRDVESFYTARNRLSTDSRFSQLTHFTQFSKTFVFDDLLLQHKSYQNSFRSMLRRAVSPTDRRPSPPPPTPPPKTQRSWSDTPVFQLRASARDSARIDSALREDARRKSKEITILALGHRHGKTTIVNQLRHKFGQPFTEDEIEQYRQSIVALVLRALVTILDYVNAKGPGLVTQSSRSQAEAIREYVKSAGPGWTMSQDVATAVKSIWRNWHVVQAFSNMQQHGQTAYYLKSIERICSPSYVPSTFDIVQGPETIETMKETQLSLTANGPQVVRIVELKEDQAMKIISAFADVQFCLFAIDLTCYDRYLDNTSQSNALRSRVSSLRSICRSPLFSKTIILLIFTNAATFTQQVATSPLSSHFEDYTGGNNADAALKYIVKGFKSVNRHDLPLFWHTFDCSENEADLESLAAFMKQSIASVSAVEWLREIGMGGREGMIGRR